MPFSVHPVGAGMFQKLFQAAFKQVRLVFLDLDGINAYMAVQTREVQKVGVCFRFPAQGVQDFGCLLYTSDAADE